MPMLGSRHLSQRGWLESTKAEWGTLMLRLDNPVPMPKFSMLDLKSLKLEPRSIKASLGPSTGVQIGLDGLGARVLSSALKDRGLSSRS